MLVGGESADIAANNDAAASPKDQLMPSSTDKPRGDGMGAGLFAVAVFFSAALVFTVEPMAAKLILPRLGGSSAVWNTSLAFFQCALLLGYGYAHLLQRIGSVRRQTVIHLAVLAAAALMLPLHISGLLGDPALHAPALWTFGVLTLSLGAPFAALSATAPLIQAWYARTHHHRAAGRDPYVLYAASNLGSLLALLAYPVAIEPALRLGVQTRAWSLGYGVFALIVAAVAVTTWRGRGEAAGAPPPALPAAGSVGWRTRILWLLLAAAPSSLLLGVTGHLTADVASAPFLWVVPLALYLLTFIIAFQARPVIRPAWAVLAQTAFPSAALLFAGVPGAPLPLQFLVHLTAFFLTALVCAQALAARRPPPARLTEFYLWMSLGGVLGGAFNAFVAPLIFNGVWEYPIVLVLAALARPWGRGRLNYYEYGGLVAAIGLTALLLSPLPLLGSLRMTMMLAVAGSVALLLNRGWAYAIALACLAAASYLPNLIAARAESHRSFFGVVQIAETASPVLGPVRVMINGSTLHGAQALQPALRCRPTTYYTPAGPIGQAISHEQARKPAITIGAVGLGTGTIASYVRRRDRLQFFEIDPLVVRLAFDPARFSYVHGCAQGPVGVTLGDARLSLEKVPDAAYDVLLVDAFSSDSVPTHLMTVEAMRTYLRVIKPDGVIILHLSNRNLELSGPTSAAMAAAGGAVLERAYYSQARMSYAETSSLALVAARSPAVLEGYKALSWGPPTHKARAWTDDYTNVAGALWTQMTEKRAY
jgi:spermidine synthase